LRQGKKTVFSEKIKAGFRNKKAEFSPRIEISQRRDK